MDRGAGKEQCRSSDPLVSRCVSLLKYSLLLAVVVICVISCATLLRSEFPLCPSPACFVDTQLRSRFLAVSWRHFRSLLLCCTKSIREREREALPHRFGPRHTNDRLSPKAAACPVRMGASQSRVHRALRARRTRRTTENSCGKQVLFGSRMECGAASRTAVRRRQHGDTAQRERSTVPSAHALTASPAAASNAAGQERDTGTRGTSNNDERTGTRRKDGRAVIQRSATFRLSTGGVAGRRRQNTTQRM